MRAYLDEIAHSRLIWFLVGVLIGFALFQLSVELRPTLPPVAPTPEIWTTI